MSVTFFLQIRQVTVSIIPLNYESSNYYRYVYNLKLYKVGKTHTKRLQDLYDILIIFSIRYSNYLIKCFSDDIIFLSIKE